MFTSTLNERRIYYCFVFLSALSESMEASRIFYGFFSAIKLIILPFQIILLFLLALNAKGRPRYWVFLSVLLLVGLYTYIVLGAWTIFLIAACFFSRDKDIRKTAKAILFPTAFIFVWNYLYFVWLYYTNRGALDILTSLGFVRYYIFYGHPNNAMRYFLFIAVLYVFLRWNRIRLIEWIVIGLLAFSVYFYTVSAAVWVLALLLVLWIGKSFKPFCTFATWFSKHGVLLCIVLSLLPLLMDRLPVINPLYTWLDIISTGRFSSLSRAINLYGITVLGTNTEFGNAVMANGYPVLSDNAYVFTLVHEGVIYLVAIAAILLYSAKKLDYKSKCCITVFLLYALVENSVFNMVSMFPVIAAAFIITAKKRTANTYMAGSTEELTSSYSEKRLRQRHWKML